MIGWFSKHYLFIIIIFTYGDLLQYLLSFHLTKVSKEGHPLLTETLFLSSHRKIFLHENIFIKQVIHTAP